MSDSKESLHFIILPLSFDEAHPLVAWDLRGPAFVFTREVVLHEGPDWAFDDGDGMSVGGVKERPVFVDSYTTAEELTCIYASIYNRN